MDIQDHLKVIGGLSIPAKMPCYSWSIPAKDCILGSKLAQQPGTVCHGCYALKGYYRMRGTREAMERRLAALRAAMAGDPRFKQSFITVLNHKLMRYRGGKRDARYFRWHDSGDLQGIAHLEIINEIALGTPKIRHWLPTREFKMTEQWLERWGKPAPNLHIRVSVPRVDQQPPLQYQVLQAQYPGTVSLSGVHSTPEPSDQFATCPAPTQGGKCLDCRKCWSSPAAVSYHQH